MLFTFMDGRWGAIMEPGFILFAGAGLILFIEFVVTAFIELVATLFVKWAAIPLIEFEDIPLIELLSMPCIVLDDMSFISIEFVAMVALCIMFPICGASSATTASGRVKTRAANNSFSWMIFFIWLSGFDFCFCRLRYQ